MAEEKKIQYFAVVYTNDAWGNTIHLWPGDSQEDCLNKLREMKEDPRILERMEATTVIKRDMSNFKDNKIFGCPKSLDVMQEKPKRGKK